MKATDLRIGNYVKYLGEITIVNSISGATTTYVSTRKSGIMPINSFQPIELTEDILLKCPQFNSISSDGFPLFISGSFVFEVSAEKQLLYINDCGVELKGLHHLQNIIKDLVQTELEINL